MPNWTQDYKADAFEQNQNLYNLPPDQNFQLGRWNNKSRVV